MTRCFRDYTNPYLPVNPSAIEGTLQPMVGPDGKKKEPESNVLLASIENMQYAVTVDVLHTVFSAFGAVQKIAIFEKNGGMQALIQYPDVTTAAVAKEALEGHCIYDGGYCKLHLTYSRHTDLNVKAHSDKSRDYTIPDVGILSVPQAPPGPTAATGWPGNSPASSMFSANDGTQAFHNGQMQPWNPSMQGVGPGYIPAASMYPPSQVSVASSAPMYPGSETPPVPPVTSFQSSQQMPQYGGEPKNRPPGAPTTGQPPLYY